MNLVERVKYHNEIKEYKLCQYNEALWRGHYISCKQDYARQQQRYEQDINTLQQKVHEEFYEEPMKIINFKKVNPVKFKNECLKNEEDVFKLRKFELDRQFEISTNLDRQIISSYECNLKKMAKLEALLGITPKKNAKVAQVEQTAPVKELKKEK